MPVSYYSSSISDFLLYYMLFYGFVIRFLFCICLLCIVFHVLVGYVSLINFITIISIGIIITPFVSLIWVWVIGLLYFSALYILISNVIQFGEVISCIGIFLFVISKIYKYKFLYSLQPWGRRFSTWYSWTWLKRTTLWTGPGAWRSWRATASDPAPGGCWKPTCAASPW